MEISFNVAEKTVSLTNPGLGAVSGKYQLIAPNGQNFYINSEYNEGVFTNPDFTNGDAVVTKNLPLDAYGNVMQTSQTQDYVFNLKLSTSATEIATFQYNKLSGGVVFGTPRQDCENNTATIPASLDLPPIVGLEVLACKWTITAPNGTSTLYYPTLPDLDCVISDTVDGTYMLNVAIAYSYPIGGSVDGYIYDKAISTLNFASSCGNAEILLCSKVQCMLEKALLSGQTQAIAITAGLAAYIQSTIACGNQVAAQKMYDAMLPQLAPFGITPNCNCGCG